MEYWKHIDTPTGLTYYMEYGNLLTEIYPYLRQGHTSMGKEHRLTCLFNSDGSIMRYAGKKQESSIPNQNSLIRQMMDYVNTDYFRNEMMTNGINAQIPVFNAVFVNWYRPISMTEDMDNIGFHSDSMTDMVSDIILSVTMCEDTGYRLFRFQNKFNQDGSKNTKGYCWQAELKNKDILIMLPGCQQYFKHCVPSIKKHLDGTDITGGRINLTFRALK